MLPLSVIKRPKIEALCPTFIGTVVSTVPRNIVEEPIDTAIGELLAQ